MSKKNILKIFRNGLVVNVGKLASGTMVSQALALAFIPILSRTYSQEAFGILSAFTAVVGFISSYSTLKYDTALVLPKKDADAYSLLKLSNILTVLITVLSVLIMFLPIPYFEEYKGLQIFIGIGVLLSVNYNNSALWNIRFKQYNHTAISTIIQSIAVFAFQYGLFFFFEIKGLVIGNILGIAISGIYLVLTRKFDWKIYRNISKNDMLIQAKRYIDFPKYFTPANAILSFSASLPIMLFVKYIPLAQIGIYGMALRIVNQPVSLISNSLRSVVLGDMAEKKNNNQPIVSWYMKIFLGLFLISLLASGGLILVGDWLITLFLGTEWIDASLYSKMLIPILIGSMVASPGIAAVRVFEMQKYNFHYSIVSLVFKGGTLVGLFMWGKIAFEYIILIYAVVNLALIIGNNSIILTKIKKYDNTIKTS